MEGEDRIVKKKSNEAAETHALDLSRGGFEQFQGKALPSTFRHLKVLVLAGSQPAEADVRKLLTTATELEKLDLSYCGLRSLGSGEHWMVCHKLQSLLLHRNELSTKESIEGMVEAPKLEWVTLFNNPVAMRPTFRAELLALAPTLRAVDHWAVTDVEVMSLRLPALWPPGSSVTSQNARPDASKPLWFQACLRGVL
eukprot:4268297-Amphidinium_carterae.1